MLHRGEIGRFLRAGVLASLVGVIACCAFAVRASAADTRHYERVSPADKGGGDIAGEGETVVASRFGDAAEFASRTVFGDAGGSGVIGQTQYLARRSATGEWATHALTPASRPDALQVFAAATRVQLFSDDMRTAMLWGYDLPGVADDTPERENLYVQDTVTGALRPVTVSQVDTYQFFEFLNPTIWGLSADAKHVAFITPTQMLPDAAPGVGNVYLWNDGVLTLAGVLPDGTTPAGGSTITPENIRGTVSADGTRIAFTSPEFSPSNDQQLYLRIDASRTVRVSEPEPDDPQQPLPDPPTGVAFQGMTPDGHNVFFVSDTPLLDADTANGPDLYRYTESANPAGDRNLTLISNNGRAANSSLFGAALVGMSDDGERVYYHTSGGELMVWDHGVTRTVNASVPRDSDPRLQLTLGATDPGSGRVSSDGNWLAYIVGGQMDVYNLRDDTLRCASCSALGSASDLTVDASVTGGLRAYYTAARPRFLSDRGQAFFSTTSRLVPEDVNGVADTYEYDGESGTLSLISTGRGSDPAMFTDASASGDDVFVVTRQQLTSIDQDNLVDLYDVRVGPAPPAQPSDTSVPCDGEGCQPVSSAAPTDDPLGSLSFDGGDASPRRQAALVARHRAAFHGSSGALPVRLGAAGRLSWSGRGLVGGLVKHARSGTVTLRLRLDATARAKLRRSGRYATAVRVTFHAADGAQTQKTVRIVFRSSAKGR